MLGKKSGVKHYVIVKKCYSVLKHNNDNNFEKLIKINLDIFYMRDNSMNILVHHININTIFLHTKVFK